MSQVTHLAYLTPLASICETRAQARELRAPESSRSRQGFRLCHSGCFLWSYPRGGFLSFFHGPAHIGHQPLQLVLGSLQLRRLRVHFHVPIRPASQRKGPPLPVSEPE
jgi:hypothetical protein